MKSIDPFDYYKTIDVNSVIELLRKQISSTNLYDRSEYNIGYRDALKDMITIIECYE